MYEAKRSKEDQDRFENLIKDAENDKNIAQQLALDASKLLAVSKQRLNDHKDSGFFKRCWYAFRGKQGELTRANEADLIVMQGMAWHYLESLQKQNLLQAQSIAVIRNNLLSVVAAEEETRIILCMLMEKFDARICEQEKILAIHDWIIKIGVSGYDAYPPSHQMLKVVFDLFKIMQTKGINFEQMHGQNYIQVAFKNLNIDFNQKLKISDLVSALIDEILVVPNSKNISSFLEIVDLKIDGKSVDSTFILNNVSGSGYNAIYMMQERLRHIEEIKSIPSAKLFLEEWLKEVVLNSQTEYSLIELAEEILAGSSIADEIYRENYLTNVPEEIGDESKLNESLNQVESDDLPKLNDAIVNDPKTPPLNDADKTKCRVELASSQDLPITTQNELLHDPDESVLVALASNPFLIEETQNTLSTTGSPAIREALAANVRLSEKQQSYLATTGSAKVKCQLAKNPSLSKALQKIFADEEDTLIRGALAGNQSLDPEYQSILWNHQGSCDLLNKTPRIVLAGNPMLSNELVKRIAYDHKTDVEVLKSLLENPSLPKNIMEEFAFYRADQFRGLIRMSRSGLAKNRFLPEAVQSNLSQDVDIEVRVALACNPSLTEALQFQLSTDKDIKVRESLACNTSLSEALQASLIEDRGGHIWQNLAKNPSLKIAQQAQLASIGSVDVRLALADNPALDNKVMIRLISTFVKSDLDDAERRASTASDKSARLFQKVETACTKWQNAVGLISIPFFNTPEKQDRLEREFDSASEQCSEAASEADNLEKRAQKIRKLLSVGGCI